MINGGEKRDVQFLEFVKEEIVGREREETKATRSKPWGGDPG